MSEGSDGNVKAGDDDSPLESGKRETTVFGDVDMAEGVSAGSSNVINDSVEDSVLERTPVELGFSSEEEDDSFKSCTAANNCEATDAISSAAFPPEFSDDSDSESCSGSGSEIFYSELDDDNDTDVSAPDRDHEEADEAPMDTAFQRELLDYLGSLFTVSSRLRSRETASMVTDEQLEEYLELRNRVNKELRVLGVGQCIETATTDQTIARNLVQLLAARERGDWSSRRRCLRIMPMWTFERYNTIGSGGRNGTTTCKHERQKSDGDSSGEPCEKAMRMDKELQQQEDESWDNGSSNNKWSTEMRQHRTTVTDSDDDYPFVAPLGSERIPTVDLTQKRSSVRSKLVAQDPEDVGLSVMLEPVSKRGQRDIRTAIYGSRWAVRRLGLEVCFPAHDGCVNALDFSSSGQWIASGSDDRRVVVTDWQRREQMSKFAVGHTSNIFQVRFLPGSSDLEMVTCSRDATVRYAALSSTGQLQYCRLLARHKDCCHKMDVPIDQPSLVISAGEDMRVLGSDVRAGRSCGKICIVDKVPLYTISCNPVRSQEFAVAGKNSGVYVFDRRNPSTHLARLCPEALAGQSPGAYHVTSIGYGRDGDTVLASYNDQDIYLLSTRQDGSGPTAVHRYCGHRNMQTVTGVAFYGPEQEFVVSGSNDGHVLLWERETEAIVNWFRADENGVVNVLEPHPTMPLLATAGLDHDVKLWSMLGADGPIGKRCLPLDGALLERDMETNRIDIAWRRIDERRVVDDKGNDGNNIDDDWQQQPAHLPFNLRDLRAIAAANWKVRHDYNSYPASDNTMENLILMSRRHRVHRQYRGVFLNDDSDDSDDSAADDSQHSASEDPTRQQQQSSAHHPGRTSERSSRPSDNCRSS